MAMSITVQINLDESGTYSPAEAAVIQALANDVASPAADQHVTPEAAQAAAPAPAAAARTKEAADARIAEAKAKAAAEAKAKAAAAAKAKDAAEAKAAEEAAAAEPEVDSDAEALAAMEADLAADPGTFTLEDAVSKATKAVSEGKAAQVKAALLAAGAKRVSELAGNDAGIATFITTLEG